MKLLILLSLFTSFAASAKCNLQIPTTTTQKVEKSFTVKASCLTGVYCSASVSVSNEASKDGYSSCGNFSSRAGGLHGVTSWSEVSGVCSKDVVVNISRSEKNEIACTRLLSCLANGDIDNTGVVELMKTFKLKCEL